MVPGLLAASASGAPLNADPVGDASEAPTLEMKARSKLQEKRDACPSPAMSSSPEDSD